MAAPDLFAPPRPAVDTRTTAKQLWAAYEGAAVTYCGLAAAQDGRSAAEHLAQLAREVEHATTTSVRSA